MNKQLNTHSPRLNPFQLREQLIGSLEYCQNCRGFSRPARIGSQLDNSLDIAQKGVTLYVDDFDVKSSLAPNRCTWGLMSFIYKLEGVQGLDCVKGVVRVARKG